MTRQVFRIGLFLTILPLLVGPTTARELTLDERVAAQRSIENVYWQHRIWPEQNHRAKPSLSEVLPESAIRAKVGNYLSLSDDLASKGKPISEQQLREEMNRMVAESRAPGVLRALRGFGRRSVRDR